MARSELSAPEDQSERAHDVAQSLAAEAKRNRFFALSPDLLATASFAGDLRELNPAWERVLGVPAGELKSRPFWARMAERDQQTIREAIARAANDNHPVAFQAELAGGDGSFHCFAWTVAPHAADQLLYLFARDITERRRAEGQINRLNADLAQRADQLLRANQELEAEIVTRKRAEEALQESNSALEAFSYSVSHDLRAPIRAMQGFSNVLLEDYGDKLDNLGKECALRIVHAAERMDSLVQDLLIYSRLGHTTLELGPVSTQEALLEALGQLDQDLKARGAQVELVEPLPVVVGHLTTLTQVFANLIANAAKFMPSGVAPKVRIWAEKREGKAFVFIQDNGIGIAPEDHSRIFRVFERLHSADDYPGTGLGLAIVRKGLDRMGGQAGLNSRLGEGSSFWISLPLPESRGE